MCPIVPMFRWGLFRSNFCLAIEVPLAPYEGTVTDSLTPYPSHDFTRNGFGNLAVGVELHRVRRATLGARTKVGSIPEHLGERHLSPDHVGVPPWLHTLHFSTARGQVADDIPHVVLGGDDLHRHDRLEQGRLGLS